MGEKVGFHGMSGVKRNKGEAKTTNFDEKTPTFDKDQPTPRGIPKLENSRKREKELGRKTGGQNCQGKWQHLQREGHSGLKNEGVS